MAGSDVSLENPSSTGTHCHLKSKESARSPGKDIWTLISEKRKADAHSGSAARSTNKKESDSPFGTEGVIRSVECKRDSCTDCIGGGDRPDAHMLVVGSPRGGKSTLIARYLNPEKDDVPKPTIGLEYTFARRTVSNSVGMDRKEVVHTWELSCPRQLEEELLTAERLLLPMSSLSTSVVVLVLDLSKPSEVLDMLIFWLEKIHQRVETFYSKLKKRGSRLPQQLVARERKLFGLDHEDLGDVKLFGVPIVIVGTKDQDTELRKTMARTLRHLAHTNGATLLYTTGLNKDGPGESRTSLHVFRSIINHLVFHTPPYRGLETDHSRPLVIPLGLDKLEDIGHPNIKDLSASARNVTKDSWITQYLKLFPSPGRRPVPSRKPEIYTYAEKEIDDLVLQSRAQAVDRNKCDAVGATKELNNCRDNIVPEGSLSDSFTSIVS